MTVTLPTPESNAGKAEWSEVYGNDKALKDAVDGIEAKFPVSDANLASPNNSAYRALFSAGQIWRSNATVPAGTYILAGTSSGNGWTGAEITEASEFEKIASGINTFGFDDADYLVTGKTQKLRVRAHIGVNGTKPTVTFTFGLYPITPGGGNNRLFLTLGTVVPGSTVAITEPAINSFTPGVGSDFTIPADGVYVLGVKTNATLTANSVTVLGAQLQTRSA